MTAPRGTAVVVGGTGMLDGFTRALIRNGLTVHLPARHRPHGSGGAWIEADWSEPSRFVGAVEHAVTGTIDLLVLWCHHPYNEPVARGLVELLEPLRVIEVVGSRALRALAAGEDPRCVTGSFLVVLGAHRSPGGGTRWLTDEEISAGVTTACQQAGTAGSGGRYIVGELT